MINLPRYSSVKPVSKKVPVSHSSPRKTINQILEDTKLKDTINEILKNAEHKTSKELATMKPIITHDNEDDESEDRLQICLDDSEDRLQICLDESSSSIENSFDLLEKSIFSDSLESSASAETSKENADTQYKSQETELPPPVPALGQPGCETDRLKCSLCALSLIHI